MSPEERRSKLAGVLALHFPYSHNFKIAIDQIEALFKQAACINCGMYDPEDPTDFCGNILGATLPVKDFDSRACWCPHFEEILQ